MVDTSPPLLRMDQEQAAQLGAHLLVYAHYLSLRVAPSGKRHQKMRMLYALFQRLLSLLNQHTLLIALSLTREEFDLVKEGLAVLVRALQEKPASPEQEQETKNLTAMQALLDRAWRPTNG